MAELFIELRERVVEVGGVIGHSLFGGSGVKLVVTGHSVEKNGTVFGGELNLQ